MKKNKNKNDKNKDWFKRKGYLHFTDRHEQHDRKAIELLLKNKSYISRHAFFPLIHYEIQERKKGKIKKRPIAFGTHLDTQIFSYYAKKISDEYEKRLKACTYLNQSVTAYRTIKDENGKGKRNIHFAKEAFDLIRKWGDCVVLTFDIKSFFTTIDHVFLKKIWADLLDESSLPPDDYNIYRAVTNFAYVRKDDLKTNKRGYNEARLSELRKKGIEAFFESGQDFRENLVQNPKIKIYKNRKKLNGRFVGIPQGLPISPVLANLYMYPFDKQIIEEFVKDGLCDYRRYSDDILVVCKGEDAKLIEKRFREIIKQKTRLQLSNHKTERFECQVKSGLQSVENLDNGKTYLTYLGFEYYGHKTLIKSATLAKFYRKMKKSIRSKANSIKLSYEKGSMEYDVLFKRKMYRNFTHQGSRKRSYLSSRYKWIEIAEGDFIPARHTIRKRHWGNTITYANEASEIMQDKRIKKQLRRHMIIFQREMKKRFDL